MPRTFPNEFKADVSRVVYNREPGPSIEQIAKDVGVSTPCLQWLKQSTGNVVTRNHPNHGSIIEVRARDGRSARWYADGHVFGFSKPGS